MYRIGVKNEGCARGERPVAEQAMVQRMVRETSVRLGEDETKSRIVGGRLNFLVDE